MYTGVSLHKNTSWYPHAQACAFLQHNLRQTPRNDPHNGDNPVVFFGNAGTDWLGTSRGSSCEGPSHHSALDSSQPCWHPSRQPPHTGTHIRKLQVSYTQIWGTSMLSSLTVTVGNNLPSDICSGLRSSRQTSRLKDSSKFLYIVTSSMVFIRFQPGPADGGGCQFFFRYSTWPYEGIAYCVCVWLNVSTTPGNRCIYV